MRLTFGQPAKGGSAQKLLLQVIRHGQLGEIGCGEWSTLDAGGNMVLSWGLTDRAKTATGPEPVV